ncbi:hypothetical protein SOVF_031480 [Spinacia oleracea]|nr:hypothetical protein SOVF_031480 [Spinacia oleracea]
MASLFNHHPFICSLLIIYIISTTTTNAAATFRPKALLLTVSKDSSTLQYTTKLIQRTPPVPVTLTLDLGTPSTWVLCGNRYVSSTYRPATCGSTQCTLANSKICRTCPPPARPGCNNNTCRSLSLNNPFTNITPRRGGELATDIVRINSTDGSNPGQLVTIPKYLFVCAPKSLLQGLAKGVSGVAGLGKSKLSLPCQFSSAFRIPQKFALCLPPLRENGVVFIGDGPYNFSPNIDVTTLLSYTPLIHNPARSGNYFIGVQGIKVGGKEVPSINKYLLSINRKGSGGTMISVNHPYTLLETSIYKAVTTAFDQQLRNSSFPARRVNPVAPFKLCYDPTSLSFTRIGPVVPDIDLVLQSEDVFWRIAATNSIVRASDNAYCLGLMDGGKNPRTSILIGGFQIEDNLLEFDLNKSRLGFTSSLIYDRIRCSFFNFTSNVL